MLSSAGRRLRLGATAAAVVMLVIGTFWGQDDHFPFGPFRMYSIRNKLNGQIRGAIVEVVDAQGRTAAVEIRSDEFGLRRAEVEGQLDRFERDPSLLRHLARSYEQLNPATSVAVLRLYNETTRLSNGQSVGTTSRTLVAEWRRR
jgi:hypothetical protein